ncbi:TPA: ATP-binding protein [Enterococcus hirae]
MSELTKSPVRALKENMILTTEKDIWAYYRMYPKNLSQNNPEEAQKTKEMLANLFQLLAPYEDIELVMLPELMDLESRFEKLSEAFDPQTKEIAEYYAQETVNLLNREGAVYQPLFILGVKIRQADLAENFKEIFDSVFRRFSEGILELFDFEPENQEEIFDDLEEHCQELTNLLRSFAIHPLTKKEMVYINRLQYIRGLYHRREDEEHWQLIEDIEGTYISPSKEKAGILRLEDELGTSYCAILPVADLPANLSKVDLFPFAQNCPFPTEVHVKVKYCFANGKGNGMLSKRVGLLKQRFKTEQEEAEMAGEEVSDHLLTIRYLLKHMNERMELGKAVVDTLSCFVVYGETEAEVRERSQAIIKSLGGIVSVSRARSDQIRLFYTFLYGRRLLDSQKSWRKRMNLDALAEFAYGTVVSLGMSSGWYIGRVDTLGLNGSMGEKTTLEELVHASKKYVFLNLQAIAEGIAGALFDSPHVAVSGKTGKGKSFLVGLLFLFGSFLDVKSLFIDPKGEKKKWFMRLVNDPYYQENYPLFVEYLKSFHYVTLDVSKKENYGVLDPFVYLEDIDVREVAVDMVNELSPLKGDHKLKGALLQEIEKVLEKRRLGDQVGFMHVIEGLKENQDKKIQEYGKYLFLAVDQSILRLGFSYGENKGLDFQTKTTILEIADLKLPKDDLDYELYSDSDRRSLCLMVSLGRFCEMFGKQDWEQKTAIYFTEAWVFNNSSSGKAVISSLIRVGRSQMNQLVLDTQFVSDLGSEEEKGNFGCIFAFDEETEREQILRHVGLEVNETNLKEMKRMIKGQCWFRDPYGRVDKLNIHSLFEEVTESLRTTSKTANSLVEEAYL